MNKAKQEFENADTLVHGSGQHEFIDWYMSFHGSFETYEKATNTLADNRAFFKEKFGRQDFCTSDSANRRLYVWKVDCEGVTLWLLTARERGTSYEYVINDDTLTKAEAANKINEYLEELFDLKDLDRVPVRQYTN